MKSMTGYGRCHIEEDGREMTVEVKSVNHRFLDISFRLNRALSFLDDAVRKGVSAKLARGHVDVFVSYANHRQDAREVRVDTGLAAAYIKSVAAGDEAALLRWCCQNEGIDNISALAFAEEARDLLTDMLCGREKSRGLERAEMLRLCGLMEKCTEYLRFNVGVKHIFGLLAVDSIAGSRNRG